MSKITSYCSWCFEHAEHTKVVQSFLTRNIYQCCSCNNSTVQCRCCNHMAKSTPSSETLKQIEIARLADEKEHGALKALGRVNSAFTKIDQSWNNELCAEHDGTIASFKSLSKKLDDISEYETLFIREQRNLAKPVKHLAYAGVGVVSIGAIIGSGGTAGPIAAAIGNMGVLGASGTGAAIAGLNGAALTSASLAAIGGSVAAGTMIVTASGAALGGVLGGVVANKFHGDDKSFSIKRLRDVKGSDVRTIFVNGFTQKGETDFHDWQAEQLFAGLRHSTYGVTWDSKSNANLGAAFAGGVGKKGAQVALAALAKKGGAKAAARMGPAASIALISDIISNPWHSAMLRAAQAGSQLAESISRTSGQKFNLVGHSLGCRVIYYALAALGTKSQKYIDDVILLGGAVGKDDEKGWMSAISTIDGNLYNCYSKQDMVLKRLYETANAKLTKPIGYYPIPFEAPKISNLDCTNFVDSHMKWKENYSEILRLIYDIDIDK
ncbi:DUF726 domain-containing protein [Shewanella sp. UCD-KL12]|uniref:DUF726 domain-containing protein n=1 Tax=Shewanella sp. UCD-KL12 TaxID=1917163 RepID=UPI0009FB1ADC|nr:DUF726 domain-containing protein [Shewanella sp. UCD-KL12]